MLFVAGCPGLTSCPVDLDLRLITPNTQWSGISSFAWDLNRAPAISFNTSQMSVRAYRKSCTEVIFVSVLLKGALIKRNVHGKVTTHKGKYQSIFMKKKNAGPGRGLAWIKCWFIPQLRPHHHKNGAPFILYEIYIDFIWLLDLVYSIWMIYKI